MLNTSKESHNTVPSVLPLGTREIGFLDNTVTLFQPSKGGHRAGLDAALLAATLPEDATGTLADFGAGNGAVGMSALQRCPEVSSDFFDNDPGALALLQAAKDHTNNASLSQRMAIVDADLVDCAGLQAHHNRYTHILSNPPYNDASHRSSPDTGRARAHMMSDDLLPRWVTTAHTMLQAGGRLTMILRPQNLETILASLKSGFGGIVVLSIHPRQQVPANRVLIAATKAGKAPLDILPPLVIHNPDGTFTDETEEILRGRSAIPMTAHR